MFKKKHTPMLTLLLLTVAVATVGASRIFTQQVPPGQIIVATGAAQSDDKGLSEAPSAPTLPTAKAAVIFSDSFDEPALKGWQTLPGDLAAWVARDGRLQQWGAADGAISNDHTVLVAKDSNLENNGIFEVLAYPTSGEPIGVVFRGSDSGYYRLTLFADLPNKSAKAHLDRVTSAGVQSIAANAKWSGFSIAQWQRITVNAVGSHIIVSLDETQLFAVNDSAFASGWVGVWTNADRGAQFDNVRIQRASSDR